MADPTRRRAAKGTAKPATRSRRAGGKTMAASADQATKAQAAARPAAKPAAKPRPAAGRTAKPAAKSRAAGKTRAAAKPKPAPMRIGVISDNHGYLDPAILELFAGVTQIIHAGDAVDPVILDRLEGVAPLIAVSGNIDGDDLVERLPREVAGQIGGVRFAVGHKRKRLMKRLAAGKLALEPPDVPPDLVIFGHEHVPSAQWLDGILYLNPGTASAPDDEDDDPTIAIVEKRSSGLSVEFIPLVRRPVES